MADDVIKSYLEMRSPAALRPARVPAGAVVIRRLDDCPVALYRRLYAEVGGAHQWVDRLPWTDGDIRAHLADPAVGFHLMEVDGEPAGYFELIRGDDGAVELGIFGVVPAYLGRGLGGHLLTVAVRTAWDAGATRVWLTTLTSDHPSALPNYQRRGFAVYHRETYASNH